MATEEPKRKHGRTMPIASPYVVWLYRIDEFVEDSLRRRKEGAIFCVRLLSLKLAADLSSYLEIEKEQCLKMNPHNTEIFGGNDDEEE